VKLDHIGFVVERIDEFVETLRTIGFPPATEPVPDHDKRVNASFVPVGKKDEIYLEVLEPLDEKSAIHNFSRGPAAACTISVSRWITWRGRRGTGGERFQNGLAADRLWCLRREPGPFLHGSVEDIVFSSSQPASPGARRKRPLNKGDPLR
jgi:hypothetical protein